MGSGITQVAAQSGFKTIQFDVSEEMLLKSKAGIKKGLEILTNKGKLTEEQKEIILNNIRFTSEINTCRADLFIEAIIENKDAKVDLFNQLMKINADDVIYATNTSSISISAIAAETKRSSNIIGMHFFNPAPVMKLVEVVRAVNTKEEIVQQVTELAKRFGKTPVVCKDSPGFIVNRVARPYYLEALRLIDAGLATADTIDTIMEASGFKMGPFKLMDLIGIDINYSVSNIVWEALNKPERLKPSLIQKEKVQTGELGKKTGKGFYEY